MLQLTRWQWAKLANDIFSYGVSDGHGGGATTNLSIEIVGTNDLPVVLVDSTATDEDTAVSGNVLSNDSDPDTSDVLRVASVNGSATNVGGPIAGAYGNLTLGADGSWTFTPNAAADALGEGQTAVDIFSYEASDGHGGAAAGSLTIQIAGTNDGPVAIANTAAVQEDTTTSATGNVLTNDTDVDTGDTKTVSAVNGAAGSVGTAVAGAYGTVTINANGSLHLFSTTPAPRFRRSVPGRPSPTASPTPCATPPAPPARPPLTVTVTGKNDTPIAVADTRRRGRKTPPRHSATGNVLTNDTDVDSGDSKTVSAVKGVAGNVGFVRRAPTAASPSTPTAATPTPSTTATPPSRRCARRPDGHRQLHLHHARHRRGHKPTTLTITIAGTNDVPVAVATPARHRGGRLNAHHPGRSGDRQRP